MNQVQSVAKPLHHRTSHEDRAFERIVYLVAYLPSYGGEQVVGRENGFFAAVHKHKAASAVGVFHHTGFGALLPEKGCLLVACDARYRHFVGE